VDVSAGRLAPFAGADTHSHQEARRFLRAISGTRELRVRRHAARPARGARSLPKRSELRSARTSKAGAECCDCRQGARRIRSVSQARCRKAQNARAIRQPPGTISATTAYGPRSRIGPARSASKFMGRSNIAASRVRIQQSPKVTKYRVSAEWHVNSPRPSQGRDTELAIAPERRATN